MAKLQLLAITTLDGYLFDRTVSSPLWDNPDYPTKGKKQSCRRGIRQE